MTAVTSPTTPVTDATTAPSRVNVRDLIRAELDFDRNAEDWRIAERVLRQVTKADLTPLVIELVGQLRREHVRRIERRGIPGLVRHFGRQRQERPSVALTQQERLQATRQWTHLMQLRSQTLDLGDGQTIRWGSATVEQLRQRLVMLRTLQAGTARTIEQLESVIEVLESQRASTLDELVTRS